tara:strand:+ start:953 stop:1528 length:576 start_codon:yes stop_codon:yes gene_type:complete
MTKKIAIFASGSGSNAENIFNYFKTNGDVSVSLILTNSPNTGVVERANRLDIPFVVFNKNSFQNTNEIVKLLQENEIDLVVLAGFLWLIPENLIEAFPNKIINIHPALLPKYGGKGMFGDNVHKAVVENKETETGITIHFVNQHYDEGKVIFQAKCEVLPTDTFDEVASKIHVLEYEHFPKVIADLLLTLS